MLPDLAFAPSVAYAEGDVTVTEVAPDALLRRTSAGPAGAAWRSTRAELWSGWRPDRYHGLVHRGMASRLAAVMFLAAVVPNAS